MRASMLTNPSNGKRSDTYDTFADKLTIGKNIPFRLKSLKIPLTRIPLTSNAMDGAARSR